MCVGVMGTALASPLYPLYQAHWGLQPSHITGIYVAYMFGALASLLLLGRLSDRFGFLPVLRQGLVLVTAGVLLSALAWSVASFVVSRVLIGIASGMITTSASIGLTQLNRSSNVMRASAMTSFAMALGFGLGPLVGGLMAQWVPQPLVTAYAPSVVLGGGWRFMHCTRCSCPARLLPPRQGGLPCMTGCRASRCRSPPCAALF